MLSNSSVSSFSAFLSHRYDSPDVNLYFFEMFRRSATVLFEVDKGDFTSVTRIERAIRAAEAFIGFFSLPADASDAMSRTRFSRYFRFELDCALRARKPILLFVDDRYGNMFSLEGSARVQLYDQREIQAGPSSPRFEEYCRRFETFRDQLLRSRETRVKFEGTQNWSPSRVGVLLGSSAYTNVQIGEVCELLDRSGFDFFVPPSCSVLTLRLQAELRRLDWAMVDLCDPETAMLGAYLHGCFVPTLRLHSPSEHGIPDQASAMEAALLNSFEVGYVKDVIRWRDHAMLLAEIQRRIVRLQQRQMLITSLDAAEQYFRSAALRTVSVFVSYAGEDRERGQAIAKALKRKFESVFDYRDERSLTPSRAWIEEIFQSIQKSKVGVALYSAAYFGSGHCKSEAQALADRASVGGLVLIGIRLEEGVQLADFLKPIQNVREWQRTDAELADEVTRIWDNLPADRRP